MEFCKILNEIQQSELTPGINKTLNDIMRDIDDNSTIKRYIDAVRQEVYNYKKQYSVMVVLNSRKTKSEDQRVFVEDAIRSIAKKYGAKVKRNNLMIKVLVKKEIPDEIK